MSYNSYALSIAAVVVASQLPAPPTAKSTVAAPGFSLASPGRAAPDELAASDWASIRAAYEESRHKAFAVGGGYEARNPGQRWTTQFDGDGFIVTPDDDAWSWGLELMSYGIGESQKRVSRPVSVRTEGQHVSYDWDSNITEWYVNDTRGLEHGFTIRQRPEGAAGDLTLSLAIRGRMRPVVSGDGRSVRFAGDYDAPALNYSGLSVFDAHGHTLHARFSAVTEGLQVTVNDTAAMYPITIDPVVQQAYLKASNTAAGDQFGDSVAVSGDTIVVGARNHGPGGSPLSGAAYVFVRSGSTWSEQAFLRASNPDSGDHFGASVSISGDTIIVGAPGEDSNATGVNGNQADNSAPLAGAAYVFVRNGTSWSQQAYLKASNALTLHSFGISVSISGDTAFVGASGENSGASNSGAAYAFVRTGMNWSQQAFLKASNTSVGSAFGHSLSVSGDTVVIGAPFEGSGSTGVNGDQNNNGAPQSGAAYVFARNGSTWIQQAYLKASNTGSGDEFGRSVSISGETIAVGAQGEASKFAGINSNQNDNSAPYAGAAYVFARSGQSWSQQAYLKPSNTGAGDQFGFSVSVSLDALVVGAWLEQSNSVGVNGYQSNNSSLDAGSAYVFVRSGNVWSQRTYLKASNSQAGDRFGIAVAINNGTVAIGAEGEDSGSIGVNGDQSNDFKPNAGAAYVFDLLNSVGVTSFGSGTAGCTGAHSLDVNLPPAVNSPGFAFTCNHASIGPPGLGLITNSADLVGADSLGVGVLFHVNLFLATELISFDIFADDSGSAFAQTGIPNNPLLLGKTYYAQVLWAWQLSPSCLFCSACVNPPYCPQDQGKCWHYPAGLSSSNGLAVVIQP